MSFATTSFFSTHFVPQLFVHFGKTYPHFKMRLLDLPPDLFLGVAQRGGFQICLHLRDLDWPKTWTSVKVGEMSWILCCRKNHPCLSFGSGKLVEKSRSITQNISLKGLSKFPYVFPVYWALTGITYGQDNFPLSQEKRLRGYETSTATSAVEIVRLTDHLAFVPEIVARPLLASGDLIHLTAPTLKTVQEPVFLTVKNDLVSQKMYTWLIALCKKNLHPSDFGS